MGNCMETCLPRQAQEDQLHGDIMETTTTTTYTKEQRPEAAGDDDQEEDVEEADHGVFTKGKSKELMSETGKGDGGIVRVKIVLTKEELQWLMMQLKSDGEMRLENMLEEIERGRKKVAGCNGWKPSLESIMETPELLEMDRSIRSL